MAVRQVLGVEEGGDLLKLQAGLLRVRASFDLLVGQPEVETSVPEVDERALATLCQRDSLDEELFPEVLCEIGESFF